MKDMASLLRQALVAVCEQLKTAQGNNEQLEKKIKWYSQQIDEVKQRSAGAGHTLEQSRSLPWLLRPGGSSITTIAEPHRSEQPEPLASRDASPRRAEWSAPVKGLLSSTTPRTLSSTQPVLLGSSSGWRGDAGLPKILPPAVTPPLLQPSPSGSSLPGVTVAPQSVVESAYSLPSNVAPITSSVPALHLASVSSPPRCISPPPLVGQTRSSPPISTSSVPVPHSARPASRSGGSVLVSGASSGFPPPSRQFNRSPSPRSWSTSLPQVGKLVPQYLQTLGEETASASSEGKQDFKFAGAVARPLPSTGAAATHRSCSPWSST